MLRAFAQMLFGFAQACTIVATCVVCIVPWLQVADYILQPQLLADIGHKLTPDQLHQMWPKEATERFRDAVARKYDPTQFQAIQVSRHSCCTMSAAECSMLESLQNCP